VSYENTMIFQYVMKIDLLLSGNGW